MKHFLSTLLIFIGIITRSQNVFEYSINSKLEFKVYSENENILHKITSPKDFKQDTPESLANSFFFATSNDILLSLYLDKEKYQLQDDSEFDIIKKTPSADVYMQLLHKTNYEFEGNEMAYVMFIVRIKDVKFPFPTLLSLIKKGNKWFIDKRANQQKLTDCLMMFKPCVLSNLVEGVSSDNDIENLISKTKSSEGNLDFTKLFDELVIIQENKSMSNKLTMSQNLDCKSVNFKSIVSGKNYLTGIFKNASVKLFDKQDKNIISQIKKNNDSIVLKSRLDFDFENKNYTVIKYNKFKANGDIITESIRLDKNIDIGGPAKEIMFLFENLKTNIFSDLMPSMNKTPIMDSELYKSTRGVYDVLNITKLYDLFKTDRKLFAVYLDK
ncbi:hypothetical protein [Flavobacterium piscis]|uniref:Uncharacterized protein n=1 Tax=Flavobacterium piscis TaxID=1114874 RepID=A0ABU1YFM6_9FLAO|nr:hypothetical protein [Flavobacterium piscis]MDR7212236.1 hypothetical protein [Flavobacterium piscis]